MSIQKNKQISKGKGSAKERAEINNKAGKEDFHTTILVILIVVFTGLSGFALGKLDSSKTKPKNFEVETVPPELLTGSALDSLRTKEITPNKNDRSSKDNAENVLVVGSKNSTKYHFPWCSGAKRIKPENTISFSSFEEARAAGYTPASNCLGLE